jgi:S-adenosylmethionine-diacylglycerol 3-amino-3-carboxypropyl transferase
MFAQSWEDPACDVAGLRPRSGDTWLAITSGGDNVLGFLLTDPAQIISVDINPAQTYLFELKRAAFLRLDHSEMLALLGVPSGGIATELYSRVRHELSPAAAAYWDAHRDWFNRGLLLQGGFERYFALLRALLRIAIGRRRLERLFTLSQTAQRRYYEQEWNTLRWRALVRTACSQYVLGRRLDPSWFVHAEARSFGAHFMRLAEHSIAELPVRTNYFLAQIVLGRYIDAETVPEYLRPCNFETIGRRLHRVTAVTADICTAGEALLPASVDCFALSNVFEYSARGLFERTRAALVRAARPGARFTLRNLLAPRRLADDPAIKVDARLSAALQAADRGFIYSWFEAATLAAPSASSHASQGPMWEPDQVKASL